MRFAPPRWSAQRPLPYSLYWQQRRALPARRCETPVLRAKRLISFDVFQTEGLRLVVIGKNLRITAPVNHGIERLLRGAIRSKIFQLLRKAHARRAMAGPFVQHAPDARRERYVREQMFSEQLFAFLCAVFGELSGGRREQNTGVASFQPPEIDHRPQDAACAQFQADRLFHCRAALRASQSDPPLDWSTRRAASCRVQVFCALRQCFLL